MRSPKILPARKREWTPLHIYKSYNEKEVEMKITKVEKEEKLKMIISSTRYTYS
jgi:hypothetical protein